MKIAILHEAAFEYGGGMKVVDSMADELDADLFIGFGNQEVVEKSKTKPKILWEQECQGKKRALKSMIKFPFISLSVYDVIIESGSGTHWYIPPSEQNVIRYIHSVPLSYKQDSVVDRISRTLREPTIGIPDKYITNSEQTSEEVSRNFGIECEEIYPPVDISKFTPSKGEGFVTISRLTEKKGVREIVNFFNSRDEKIKIVGSGPLLDELREKSDENVNLTGWVSEEEKIEILNHGNAFVLNSGNESFGIAPVEAMASGMPIIARDGGYTPNQIDDGYNGILYQSLSDGIERFISEGVDASVDQIFHESKKYSIESFSSDIHQAIYEVT